jgi:paraquat-inducible protein B
MARKANSKLIGGFVTGAVMLAIAGVVAFGGGAFLTKKDKAVLFFSSASLSGLDVGSPVTFRGVKIGSVVRIVIRYDVANQALQIPVFIEVEPNRIEIVTGRRDSKRNLQALVNRGLRAQLVVQSLVTGQASIDFNFHPEIPINLVGAEPGIAELPTIPSDIDLLKANLSNVLRKIAALPLDQIAARSLETVDRANDVLASLNAQVEPLSSSLESVSTQAVSTLREAQQRLQLRDGEPLQNLNGVLTDARQLVGNVDKNVAPIVSRIEQFVDASLVTLEQFRLTLETARGSVSSKSPLYFQLNQTLREIQSTASSIRAFADYVQRHPDALLLGKH